MRWVIALCIPCLVAHALGGVVYDLRQFGPWAHVGEMGYCAVTEQEQGAVRVFPTLAHAVSPVVKDSFTTDHVRDATEMVDTGEAKQEDKA